MILTDEDLRARACSELRRGLPVILRDDAQAVLVLSAEMATQKALDSSGDAAKVSGAARPIVAISDRRAVTIKARAYDGDLARISPDGPLTTRLVHAIADPALDLDSPLQGPYRTQREGSADLARAALALCKRAKLLPAAVLWSLTLQAADSLANAQRLVSLPAPPSRPETAGSWVETVSARVPISAHLTAALDAIGRVGWDDEHYALEIGDPPRDKPVLTRLHSACATGDLFGSLKCDCGPQLHAALRRIAEEGAGVLVYLQQEGRGIGLANKMRAYRLQDQGFDTVDANHRLGFQDDERLLSEGGQMLRAMGFSQARLMTNNPRKIAALTEVGIEVVERVPLQVGETDENKHYLAVKAEKSGHIL